MTLIVGVMVARDRTGFIGVGYTMLNSPMVMTDADTINTSQTVTYLITNLQKYAQNQVFSFDLTAGTGSPSIAISAYGRVTSTSAWVQIGSTITWTSGSNDGDITSTNPINYNYFKIEFVASGATQHTHIASFVIKTSNAFEVPVNSGTLTVSRATSGTVTLTSKDDDANAALTVTPGGTGALVLGNGSGTGAVNTSDWDVSTTGAMTGIGAITMDGLLTSTLGATITGAAINLNASSNFATNIGTGSTTEAVTIGGGSNTFAVNSSALDISTTGAVTGATTITASGLITATGGITLATTPRVFYAAGGAPIIAATGTDVACANGTKFWVEVDIPYNVTLTGVGVLLGSVGGTDSICVQLHNSAGVQVATNRSAGGTATLLGTTATFQNVAFASTYAAVAGRYYVSVQFNGTTGKFRAYPIAGSKFIAGTVAGTWGTMANITPGTTFTADKGPICFLY